MLARMQPAIHGGDSAPEPRNPFAAPFFARWWLASLVAGTGVGIQSVTVPLFLRDRVEGDVRALAIAAALVAQTLPGALLALVGGTLADRIERRRILVRTYGIAAVVSTAYVALAALDVRTIWPVLPLAAVVGAASAFTNPARQSMLPALVSRAQLQNGVILGTMGFMASLQVLGPTLGGVIADAAGLTPAFGLEVALLAIAAVAFSTIPSGVPPPSQQRGLADLAEGVRSVARNPAIRTLLLLATVPGLFFIGPFAVTIALMVPDVFHASDKWVGLLWGCFGGGVFAGSLLLIWRPLPRRGLAICASHLFGGGVLVLYGLSQTLWLSALLLVVWGLVAAVFINYAVVLLQEHTDPRMMGRVMSMYMLAFFLSSPIGYAQAGAVTSAFGPQVTLVASGVVAAAIGVASLAFARSVRALY
jgi:MFS family permease